MSEMAPNSNNHPAWLSSCRTRTSMPFFGHPSRRNWAQWNSMNRIELAFETVATTTATDTATAGSIITRRVGHNSPKVWPGPVLWFILWLGEVGLSLIHKKDTLYWPGDDLDLGLVTCYFRTSEMLSTYEVPMKHKCHFLSHKNVTMRSF